MAVGYRSFEDLEVYKLAREFRKKIYKLIMGLPQEEKFNLVSQMRRAAASLTNNIAESHGRYHYQESFQFCCQTRGSLSELIDGISICIDENYLQETQLDDLKKDAYTLNKVMIGYIACLNRRKNEKSESTQSMEKKQQHCGVAFR